MFKVNHLYDKNKDCQKEFKTLKSALIYCAQNSLVDSYQIVKEFETKTLDTYEIFIGDVLLTAQSCSTGRIYEYVNL